MGQKQLELARMEKVHAINEHELLASMFTGQELYNWMVGRLSSLYYQLYDITLPMCLMAKEAIN